MLRILTDYAEAMLRLQRMTAFDQDPCLDVKELEQLLTDAQVAQLWVANTAYRVGDVIVPNLPNGHKYVCTVEGTSGGTEPSLSSGNPWPEWPYTSIEEGTSDPMLCWQEAGVSPPSLWHLRTAARKGWEIKMGKAAARVDFSTGTKSIKMQQTQELCERMARHYRSLTVA